MIIISKSKKLIYKASFNIDGAKEELEIPIYCPNHSNGCGSENIKKNGHDSSVKDRPQWLFCKDCNKQFYIHTSGWFIEFQEKLRDILIKLFDGGRYNVREIKAELKCSNSAASRILMKIVDAINNSPYTELCWTLPAFAKVLFVDETFIKINRTKYWLVAVVNEARRVLAFELVNNRKKNTLEGIMNRAKERLSGPIDVLVSDDFSPYTGIAQEFGHDIIHVRHIHKPPFGRAIISNIKHTADKLIITNAATYTNILDSTNMFYTRVTTFIKNKPVQDRENNNIDKPNEVGVKKKQGRPKGSKNRPKSVIKAEKKEKNKKERQSGKTKKTRNGKK